MGTPAIVLGRIAAGAAAASLVLVTVTAVAVASPSVRHAVGFGSAPAYATHGRIDVPSAIYESSPHTLVVFARSTCTVCQRSVPFLAQLVREAARAGVQVRLLSSAPLTSDELAYARALGLDPTQVVATDWKTLRVKRVPTLVLVNQRGEIDYAREGSVPALEQEDLLRQLRSLMR